MNLKDIEARLEVWQSIHIEFMTSYDAFHDLTGALPDCELFNSVFRLLDAHTDSVSEVVGDHDEYLDWFAYDCEMGKKPKTVILKGGKKLKVATIKQLARLIELSSNP